VYYVSKPKIQENSDPQENTIRDHNEHITIYTTREIYIYQTFTFDFVTPIYNVMYRWPRILAPPVWEAFPAPLEPAAL
jgi:hypothetical protein